MPTVNSVAPRECSVAADAGVARSTEISIAERSRPSLSQCSARIPSLRSNVAASEKLCQMSACLATSRSVFFSPPPPINTGIFRVGAGLSWPSLPRSAAAPAASASSRPGSAELVAVLVVVLLEPAGAGAEDQPAAADVVDGAGHVGLQVRIAVGVAVHQAADLDPLVCSAIAASIVHALEVPAVRVAVQREEVVPVEDDVHAEVLAGADGVADRRVEGVLGLDLHADTHRSGGSRRSRHGIRLGSPRGATSARWRPACAAVLAAPG